LLDCHLVLLRNDTAEVTVDLGRLARSVRIGLRGEIGQSSRRATDVLTLLESVTKVRVVTVVLFELILRDLASVRKCPATISRLSLRVAFIVE
jgi:hypothetical protein